MYYNTTYDRIRQILRQFDTAFAEWKNIPSKHKKYRRNLSTESRAEGVFSA